MVLDRVGNRCGCSRPYLAKTSQTYLRDVDDSCIPDWMGSLTHRSRIDLLLSVHPARPNPESHWARCA